MRDDAPQLKFALADQLADLGRLPEADALLAALAAASPHWTDPCILRADLAARRGDADAERARLREALARSPSQRAVRERLAALGDADPARGAVRGRGRGPRRRAARRSRSDSADSVVKLVDHGVVWVFADGSEETFTQELFRVRDLKGCEQLGEQHLSGDVLRVATIKPDGTEFEPVNVDGSYVMPDLKPGDCVGRGHSRRARSALRRRAALRLVVLRQRGAALPALALRDPPARRLPVRREARQLEDGVTEAQREEGGGVVHVFEAHGRPRVLEQPHAAAEVALAAVGRVRDGCQRAAAPCAARGQRARSDAVTPELRQAALTAVAGISGDEARAVKLHDFVNASLDSRSWQGATAGLVGATAAARSSTRRC